jgi:hypothetical protein
LLYIDHDTEKYILESRTIEEEYKNSCEWISDLGIEFKRTRFGDYEKDFSEFIKGGGKENAKESVKTFFNAQLEANDLIRVKNAFDSFNSAQALDTIKKSVAGQKFRNGSKTDQSRDFAFELSMASRFIKAGYDVDLRTITDIVVEIDGRRLYVECKRIKSEKQLEKRVKEANSQTKVRISGDTSSRSRSFIALNLTDVINPTAMPIIQSSLGSYQRVSAATLKDYVTSNTSTLSKKQHNKCLGVFTEFTTQGFINTPDEYAFVNLRESNFFRYKLKTSDIEFLNTFFPQLGNQNIV